MEDSKFICESHIIRDYGFSKSIIREHVGEPDKTTRNPHCPSNNREIRWHYRWKIESIMRDPDVKKDLLEKEKRSEARKKNRESKIDFC